MAAGKDKSDDTKPYAERGKRATRKTRQVTDAGPYVEPTSRRPDTAPDIRRGRPIDTNRGLRTRAVHPNKQRRGLEDTAPDRAGRDTAVLGIGADKTRASDALPPSHGQTIADRIGLPKMAVPISLISLPGERTVPTRPDRRDGKFLLGDKLGEGGMGRVITAYDRDLGRSVALKTLRREHLHDERMTRALLFEARISGQLQHPHIVPVHSVGTLNDGRVYYTMKLVSELSLRDVLTRLRDNVGDARKTYSLTRLLQFLHDICMAVEYAHARGVIHRDLKPDNVLIGDYGEVQIMDWGVARILPEGPDGPAYFAGAEEHPGAIIGTPHYMSPEQARGDTRHVGPRSDIYSLGLILYQMLTYTLPHSATTTGDQLEALLTEEVPPPSTRAPNRDIPEELERICMRALAYAPAKRYKSARAMWLDVEAFLEGAKEQERLARATEAQLLVAEVAAERYARLRRDRIALEETVHRDQQQSRPLDLLTMRKKAWDRSLSLEHKRIAVSRAFAEAVAGYHQVLAYEPHNVRARRALATLYQSQASDAEQRGDNASMVLYGELALAATEPGTIEEHARLNVRSYPEGADIRLFEFTGRDTLDTRDLFDLGVAPVSDVELRPGSYLLSARLPGYRETQLPVVLAAGDTRHVLMTLQPWSFMPVFGQGDALAILRESFQRAVSNRHLTSILLCGEPGLGQGNLLGQFDAYLDDLTEEVVFSYVRCRPDTRHVPLWVTAEILRHRAGVSIDDSPETIRNKFDDVIRRAYTVDGQREMSEDEIVEARVMSQLVSALATNNAPESESQPQFTVRAFIAASRFFAKLAQTSPIVLVIRGAEYIDRLSRDLLLFMARELRQCPVFFLGLADHDAAQLGFARTIELKALDREGVHHQLARLLRGPVSSRLSDLVFDKSGGNSFYITELTKLLLTRDWVTWDGRRWTPTEDDEAAAALTELDMEGVFAMILERAPAAAREFMTAAAVSGERFWEEELAARLDEPVHTYLSILIDLELVRPMTSSRFPNAREFAIRHHAIRRALYETIPEDQRAQAHARVAAWVSAQPNRNLADEAFLADHLARSGTPEEAGRCLDQVAQQATRWEKDDAPLWLDWPIDNRSGLWT